MRQFLSIVVTAIPSFCQAVPATSFDAPKLNATAVTYKGRSATRLVDRDGSGGLAVFKDAPFHNGAIEVELAGHPGTGSAESARGFVGIAFRVQNGGAKYEVVYLRPTNGRADDMLRRNHSTQYEAEPEWPWNRLRNESPGVYESYVDLEAGAWTRYRLVVKGVRAELYVNGAAQPCLIVKDLKLGDISGPIALWIGPGTESWFANLKVTREP
jgi:hypothetical protein